ncbi:uncharacterized protein LOC124168683 [Ischnura elegans]|uniref:uncharacterized protein LOC124168683 n=1 Tax=Ischnura elegans TaxID=197161 RepID=UPI001ED8A97C|nr:uncharacterized protein LOC124168683 [Ischnura elegans]
MNICEGPPTKRCVLSTIAKLYDPCGWLTPVILWAKYFIQLLWTVGLQWDDSLPPEMLQKWSMFLRELPELNKIIMYRQIFPPKPISVELHGFSDASEHGYAACVYVRSTDQKNGIKVSLLIAKSRVSPLKRVTLPRLELCGAHILAKLLKYSHSILCSHYSIDVISAWCDSTIVLAWLQRSPHLLKTFVANRVADIQDKIPPHHWHHVVSSQNPADCASRGLMPSQLQHHPLWWKGPPWLSLPHNQWPFLKFPCVIEEDLPECKSSDAMVYFSAAQPEWDLLTKFSSWSKLQYVVSYVLRFIAQCQRSSRFDDFITSKELINSTMIICKLVQQAIFQHEIIALKKGNRCSIKLLRLAPFLDDYGLLRLLPGARLNLS